MTIAGWALGVSLLSLSVAGIGLWQSTRKSSFERNVKNADIRVALLSKAMRLKIRAEDVETAIQEAATIAEMNRDAELFEEVRNLQRMDLRLELLTIIECVEMAKDTDLVDLHASHSHLFDAMEEYLAIAQPIIANIGKITQKIRARSAHGGQQ